MKSFNFLNVAKWTALASIFAGLLIELLYFLTGNNIYELIGWYFLLTTAVVNSALLLTVLVIALIHPVRRKKALTVSGIISLNIPAAWFCLWFSFLLMDTERITFVNSTNMDLREVKVIGNDTFVLDNMKPGENEFLWMPIKGDCSVNIYYKMNGQEIMENVIGYSTNGTGKKTTYHIDGKGDF